MSEDIHQAIKDCTNGKTESFALLYDVYVKKVYNFLFYRTLHKETAEDLTSLTFFKALDKISSFNPKKAQFQTWLFQIAKNSLIDYFRKSYPTENLETAWDLKSSINIFEETADNIDVAALRQNMEILSPSQRNIVILKIWDGLSHKEIAEILNIEEGSSKVQFSRAVAKLKETSLLTIILLKIIN